MRPHSIEPLDIDYAPVLAMLHAESFGAERWSEDQIRGSLSLETTRGWLAKTGGGPAGFLLCQTVVGETEILTLCVKPSLRRLGIGIGLLRSLLNDTPRGHVIHLEVASDNKAARSLYEKCGFSAVGVRPGYCRRGQKQIEAIRYRLML